MNISFSGCGFTGLYHLGVVRCLREHAPAFVESLQRVAGASAGSLAALMLVTGMSVDSTIEAILVGSRRAQSLWMRHMNPFFDLMGEIEGTLRSFLPDDAHKIASDKLFVSLTTCRDLKNVLVSDFESQKDLIQAVLTSCYVPVWASYTPVTFRGQYCMDGGFTDNLPQNFPGETITVSPFFGDIDICPKGSGGAELMVSIANTSLHVSLQNIMLMKQAVILPDLLQLVGLVKDGYNDCLRFLQFRGFDLCSNGTSPDSLSCHTIQNWEELVPERLHSFVRGESPSSGLGAGNSCANDENEEEEKEGESVDGELASRGSAVSTILHPIISITSSLGQPVKNLFSSRFLSS